MLNNDDIVMGVYWYQRETNGGANNPNIRILDLKNFGLFMQNSLENGLDGAPEDVPMDNANVDVYPDPTLEAWEQCHFNLDFPKSTLRQSFESMAECFSNPLIKND